MFTPLTSKVCSIKHPFDENHADQITKQAHEEDQLGKKFHEYLTVVPLTHFVPETWTENLSKEIEKKNLPHHESKCHMHYSKNQRNFHFVTFGRGLASWNLWQMQIFNHMQDMYDIFSNHTSPPLRYWMLLDAVSQTGSTPIGYGSPEYTFGS